MNYGVLLYSDSLNKSSLDLYVLLERSQFTLREQPPLKLHNKHI